jgi:hypothetical protein
MDETTLSRYEQLFIAATRISAALNNLECSEVFLRIENSREWEKIDNEWEKLTDCLIGSSEDPVMTNRLPELQDLT